MDDFFLFKERSLTQVLPDLKGRVIHEKLVVCIRLAKFFYTSISQAWFFRDVIKNAYNPNCL